MHSRKYTFCIIRFALAITLVLALASCRSTKKDGIDGTTSESSQVTTKPSEDDKIVATVAAARQTARGIRSRVSVKLKYGGKSASASGQLKMKRDEIIQVTITALGIMEVGRLELTPQYLLVLDRVNKQYLQTRWSEVPELVNAGVDFTTFQALFWNELFVPGISGAPAATDFQVEHINTQLRLTPKASRANTTKVAANFLVGATNALLQQTNVTPTDGRTKMSFQCTYSDWGTLAQKKFPQEMFLSVMSGSKNYSLTLSSSNLQVDESMSDLSTRVNTGYKRVTLDEIMKMLAQ